MQGQGQPSRPAPQIRTIAVKMTHIGQTRDQNEDFVAIEIPGDETLRAKGSLNLVADGMGGYQAGEVASQRAAEVAIQEYYADPNPDIAASLSRALHLANSAVYEMAQFDLQRAGMGTTAVAAVVRGSEVHIANVGDSRAYLLRKGQLTQITKDHSFVQEQIDAKILTPEAARTHPKRNVITRALGHKPQVEVDTFEGQLAASDLLLLCSDGLSGTLNDSEMAAILSQYTPQEAIIHLINEANLRGGPDNISAVLVKALPYDTTLPAAIEVTPGVRPTPVVVSKRPSGAPVRPKRGRRRLVFLGLAVILLLAVLIAGSFVVLGGKDDDQAPTFTLLPPLGPTATITPTLLTPSSTPLGTLGDIDATSTSVSTPAGTNALPTATLPDTLLPTSTTAPTSVPTSTAESPQGETPQAASLQLVNPAQGREYKNPITFQWHGPLGVRQSYQVTALHATSGYQVQSPLLKERSWTVDLPAARHGEWRWTVSVVEVGNTINTSSEGMFWFNALPGSREPSTTQETPPAPIVEPSRTPPP